MSHRARQRKIQSAGCPVPAERLRCPCNAAYPNDHTKRSCRTGFRQFNQLRQHLHNVHDELSAEQLANIDKVKRKSAGNPDSKKWRSWFRAIYPDIDADSCHPFASSGRGAEAAGPGLLGYEPGRRLSAPYAPTQHVTPAPSIKCEPVSPVPLSASADSRAESPTKHEVASINALSRWHDPFAESVENKPKSTSGRFPQISGDCFSSEKLLQDIDVKLERQPSAFQLTPGSGVPVMDIKPMARSSFKKQGLASPTVKRSLGLVPNNQLLVDVKASHTLGREPLSRKTPWQEHSGRRFELCAAPLPRKSDDGKQHSWTLDASCYKASMDTSSNFRPSKFLIADPPTKANLENPSNTNNPDATLDSEIFKFIQWEPDAAK